MESPPALASGPYLPHDQDGGSQTALGTMGSNSAQSLGQRAEMRLRPIPGAKLLPKATRFWSVL